ncbi:MAG: hypothetical protein DLM50_08385 [Candidatus Meridianibacter frigidus]|nr:MAG: hypothetical protein DLM50_08385 [Candidatus Eremiobacteraeota bacterium]
MIQSFADKDVEALFREGKRARRFAAIANVAERKLAQINSARTLADLAAIPGNRFEQLKGGRHGECSIRINDQFRCVFQWHRDGPHDVNIEDYHS